MLGLLFLFIYIIILFYILFKDPLVYIAFYFLFSSQTFVYFSVVYLDQGGIFMYELGKVTTPSNTSIIVFLFNIIATIIILVLVRQKKGRLRDYLQIVEQKQIPNIKYWVFSFYIVVLILIIHIVISGSPLWVLTINKTTFWTIAKFPFLSYVSSQITVIALFSGMFLLNNACQRKSKFIRDSLYGIYLLLLIYLVLLGHKFGLLIHVTVLFFMPLLMYQTLNEKFPIKKVISYALVFVSIILIPIIYYYTSRYGDAAFAIMQQRIFALQGQLTYISIQKFIQGNIVNGLQKLMIEIEYIFGLVGKDTYVGMKFLMSQFMPPDYFRHYLANQVNLAGGYIAILLMLFNNLIVVLFIHASFVVMFFFSGYLLISSILKYDLLLTFIYLKIYFSFFSYYAQGYTTAIFNIKTLIYVYVLIMIMLLRRIVSRKKKSIVRSIEKME